MKQKINELLQKKFAGVRKDALLQLARVLALQAATEDDAKQVVEKLTDAQVNDFVKEFRADVDREVSNATKTARENIEKEFKLVRKETTEPGGGDHNDKGEKNDPNDISAVVAAAVEKAVAPLNERIAELTGARVSDERLNRLNGILKDCKDENLKAKLLKDYARMSFKDDEAFGEYLTETTESVKTANQSFADNKLSRQGGSPLLHKRDDTGESQAVKDFIADRTAETKDVPLSGKSLT